MTKKGQAEPKPICEKLQYLIGVPSRYIDNYDILNEGILREVRKLCSLRTLIIENFTEINVQFRQYIQLRDIPETSELVNDLLQYNIEIVNIGSLSRNVIELNELIDARMEVVSLGFDDIPQEWIIELFRMPNGNEIDGVRAAVRKYRQFKNFYPYQRYINWPFAATPEEKRSKNILGNDDTLLELLTEIHCDKTAKLRDFIGTADKVAVIVDCENSDAQRLYDTISVVKNRLHKIILVDDAHTNKMWDEMVREYRETGILVEHDEFPRINEHKSLVDHRMVVKACEEFYKNQVRYLVLVTSDSDIWALINSLHDAEILVLAERCKSGDILIDALTQRKIPLLFMEDLTEESTELRDRIVYREIDAQLQNLDLDEPEAYRFVVKVINSLNLYLDKADVQAYVQWTQEEIVRRQVEISNGCEIEELRTHDSWFTGHTTEKPDKVVVKVYDSAGKFKESIIIPSVYYPLSGKYEIFNYTNTHMIGCAEEDRRILMIFDKIPYRIGDAYTNADAMTKALRKEGYNAQTYVGWMLFNGSPVHHAWTVLWVHERPSVLDLTDQLAVMEKEMDLNVCGRMDDYRAKVVEVTMKLMKSPHHERCAPVGIPSLQYYLVGTPSNGSEGIELFNRLITQFPDHPCMSHVNKRTGSNLTQDILRKKMG